MIPKKVHFPFLFILLLFLAGCGNPKNKDIKNYSLFKEKAEVFSKNYQFDSAYFYYTLAKERLNDQEDENHTYVLLKMATIQDLKGDLSGSEETITEALENSKDSLYKPYLYNMLAISYDRQKRYDDALLYYKKVFYTVKDPLAKAVVQNNIGLIYREKGQHQKAIGVLKPLLKNRYLLADTSQLARVLDNLGYAQFKANSLEAYSNLSESLRLRDSINDISGSIPSYIHLSEFFINKDKEKAREYAEKALDLSNKINSANDRLESLRWIVLSEQDPNGNYIEEFIQLNDSVNLNRAMAKNQFAKIRFDSAKAIEGKERAEQKTRNVLIVLAAITFILLIVIYLVRYINRKRLKASVHETENRIAKKVHDELANNVYQTMAFANTQNFENKESRGILLDKLEKIYNKARDISQNNGEVLTDERYGDFLLDLINSFNSTETNIITIKFADVDWAKIGVESKIALYRVLQELLVNMKKYSAADLVSLNFETKSKLLEIRYSDNGKGIDFEKFSKKGLHYAENRITAVKGTFTFDKETPKGVRVTIQIPK